MKQDKYMTLVCQGCFVVFGVYLMAAYFFSNICYYQLTQVLLQIGIHV